MFRWIFLFLLLGSGAAHAQFFQNIIPPPLPGQAVMSVGQSSTAVVSGNVTLAPNSRPFPASVLPTGTLRLKAQISNSGNLSVCWRGGNCSATNGELLAAGESRVVALPDFAANPPTLYCVTGTCVAEIEW